MATRRDLFDPTDPATLQPEQRQREIAAILAAGVIRMREQRAVTVPKFRPCRNEAHSPSSPNRGRGCVPKISPESGGTRLELSHETRPDGQCG